MSGSVGMWAPIALSVLTLGLQLLGVVRPRPRLTAYAASDATHLDVWVTNRGRTAGRIHHVQVGGQWDRKRREVLRAVDITERTGAGDVSVSGVWERRVPLDALSGGVRDDLERGFVSVWVWSGAARPCRADVMPRHAFASPAVRARTPRSLKRPRFRARLTRWLPIAAVALAAPGVGNSPRDVPAATSAGTAASGSSGSGWTIAALVLLAFVVWWQSRADAWDNRRRRIERKFVYWVAAVISVTWASGIPSLWHTVGLVGLAIAAMALAVPGEWVRVERPVHALRRGLLRVGQRIV